MPLKNPEAQRAYIKQWRIDNREKQAAIHRRYHQRARTEVLAAYGGHCQCCGEDREPFLCLDHINGDGAEHRKTVSGGSTLYVRLRKLGYPPGFQVLCANCNMAKERPEGCPHR